MNNYNDLQEIINENRMPAEIIINDGTTESSIDASNELGVNIDNIVKSICLTDKDNRNIVVILKGSDKIDLKKVSDITGYKKVRLMTKDEIKNRIGYEAGGVPPIGYQAIFIMDKDLLNKDTVYCGGGSKNAILKINVKDIIKIDKPIINDIKK